MIKYEAILQYNLDGQLLWWVKIFSFSNYILEEDIKELIRKKVKLEYSIFELIKITRI